MEASAGESAKEMLNVATAKASEATRSSGAAVDKTGFFPKYIQTNFVRIRGLFDNSPYPVKVGLLIIGGMSAIPLGIFVSFMTMVTIGCFVLGSIAFSVVEVDIYRDVERDPRGQDTLFFCWFHVPRHVIEQALC